MELKTPAAAQAAEVQQQTTYRIFREEQFHYPDLV
jgi:hypothetical protein